MTNTEMERREERWHIGKEFPLALIFLMASQTGIGIWWAATQTAKTDTLITMISEFKNAQYTKEDARRDMEITFTRHGENKRRIEALEAVNSKSGQ